MIKEEINMATDYDTNDFFKSRFFKAANDLGEEGAELIVTIKDVGSERVGREKELRPILSFAGDVKPLVLNKTNWSTLRTAFGPPKNWPGQKITLVAREVEFGNETTLGTRVRVTKKPISVAGDMKAAESGSARDDMEQDIPF
jgi:hypothetical protein